MLLFKRIILFALLGIVICAKQTTNTDSIKCPPKDEVCAQDKLGFDAIQHLHLQIDDDHNGNLDREESDEFIRDELKYEDGFDRQAKFHGSDDLISIDDLWHLWTKSPVYNWTVDDTLDWLVNDCELPQYVETFKINAVDGHTLPRIAAANNQYVSSILGIKHIVHKQKLSLKAMDLVLFGPPKKGHSYLKDVALVASLVIALGGCWLAYVQNKYSQSHIQKVMKDLATLQTAEDALRDMQQKLAEAQKEQQITVEEKETIEEKMKDEIMTAKNEADRLKNTREATAEEIARLKLAEEELVQVRSALRRAERQFEERQTAPNVDLQPWLQYTYELESKHYELKKENAAKQLHAAKEMCEKIRKKRGAFLGSFKIAHTTSIDDTDQKIMNARAALEEVKFDLQERAHRWKQIEKICGFNIVLNPGLFALETLMKSSGGHPLAGGASSLLLGQAGMGTQLNVEDADEDLPPGYYTAMAALCSTPMLRKSCIPGSIHNHRTEHMVWPNLMRAGMQLTMFGLGMTNHQAGMVPHINKDSRIQTFPTNLGSCNSLNSSGLPRTSSSTLNRSQTTGGLMSLPSDTDTGSEESMESIAAKNNGGKVTFGLGEVSEQKGSHELLAESTKNGNQSSLPKSVSCEDGKPIRPRSLVTSQSDPALCSPGRQNVHKRITSLTPTTPTVEEDMSSENLSDSTSLSEDGKKDKKKKKKKQLLTKLFSKNTDKTKAS